MNDAESLTHCMVARFGAVKLLYSSLFFEHYNRILLCELRCLFEDVCMPQHFHTLPGLDQGWTVSNSRCIVIPSVTGKLTTVLRKCLQPCCSISKLAIDRSVVSVFINRNCCRLCIFVLCGLRVCYKTLKLNNFTKKYTCFCNLFEVRRTWNKAKLLKGGVAEKRLRTTGWEETLIWTPKLWFPSNDVTLVQTWAFFCTFIENHKL